MRSLSILAMALVAACASKPEGPPPKLVCVEAECAGADIEKVELGKQAVADLMNVPAQAQIRDVYLTDRALCGRATGINALGGYPALRQFIAVGNKAALAPRKKRSRGIADGIENMVVDSKWSGNWRRYCRVSP